MCIGYKPNLRKNINKAINSIISKFTEKYPNIHYTDNGPIYLGAAVKAKRELMQGYFQPNVDSHVAIFEVYEVLRSINGVS
jgi:hypothetical protein